MLILLITLKLYLRTRVCKAMARSATVPVASRAHLAWALGAPSPDGAAARPHCRDGAGGPRIPPVAARPPMPTRPGRRASRHRVLQGGGGVVGGTAVGASCPGDRPPVHRKPRFVLMIAPQAFPAGTLALAALRAGEGVR